MSFAFHPEADEEFVEAVAYYEESDTGLGIDFLREVYSTIRTAHAHSVGTQPGMYIAGVPSLSNAWKSTLHQVRCSG